jgi:hypothetical protein
MNVLLSAAAATRAAFWLCATSGFIGFVIGVSC